MPGNGHEQATLEELARKWQAEKRNLWVVAGDGLAVHDALPEALASSTRVASNGFFLERTLLERPEHYQREQFSLVLAPVPTG